MVLGFSVYRVEDNGSYPPLVPGERQGNATTKKGIGKSIDEKPISLYRRFLGKFEYLPQKNIFVEIRGVYRASRGIAYFGGHGL